MLIENTVLIKADGTIENAPLDFCDARCLVSAKEHAGWTWGCDLVSNGRLVGAVSDTGLLDKLPHNLIASLIFRQHLYGDCFVFVASDGDEELLPIDEKGLKRELSRLAKRK